MMPFFYISNKTFPSQLGRPPSACIRSWNRSRGNYLLQDRSLHGSCTIRWLHEIHIQYTVCCI